MWSYSITVVGHSLAIVHRYARPVGEDEECVSLCSFLYESDDDEKDCLEDEHVYTDLVYSLCETNEFVSPMPHADTTFTQDMMGRTTGSFKLFLKPDCQDQKIASSISPT